MDKESFLIDTLCLLTRRPTNVRTPEEEMEELAKENAELEKKAKAKLKEKEKLKKQKEKEREKERKRKEKEKEKERLSRKRKAGRWDDEDGKSKRAKVEPPKPKFSPIHRETAPSQYLFEANNEYTKKMCAALGCPESLVGDVDIDCIRRSKAEEFFYCLLRGCNKYHKKFQPDAVKVGCLKLFMCERMSSLY